MICKNCGKEIADGVNFCKFCGTRVVKEGSEVKVDLAKENEDSTTKVLIEKENDSNVEVNIKLEVKNKEETPKEESEKKETIKEEQKKVSRMQQALNNLSNKSKKCPGCGMLVIDNARFCTNCGAEIK